MSDLHVARDLEREPGIDTVRWLFLAFAIAITAAAAMIAYRANHDCKCPCVAPSRALGVLPHNN